MFNLFDSKNKKIVKKWKKEHEEIVILATEVVEEYSKNNINKAKKKMKELNSKTVSHLMSEDIEFYKIMRDQNRLTEKTLKEINSFKKSFSGVKLDLMIFLKEHSKDSVVLNDDFFKKFTSIVDLLGERIQFEEENLYRLLMEK
jgi:hypothetical protein